MDINNQDPNYLEPVREELDALRQAKDYLKTCSLRETASGYIEKQEDTYHMSDLKKDLNEVAPPKPKKVVQQKAKKSTQQILARSRKKVAKAEQSLRSAKRSAENIKNKLLTINKSLQGKDTQLLTEDQIESAPKTIQEHINQQEVIFKPNTGPQTQFLAASEREVFYGGARGGGKSYAMLVDPLRYCSKAHHRALLIRRTMPELRDLIQKSQLLYSKAFPGAKWREQEKEWRFPSGSKDRVRIRREHDRRFAIPRSILHMDRNRRTSTISFARYI